MDNKAMNSQDAYIEETRYGSLLELICWAKEKP